MSYEDEKKDYSGLKIETLKIEEPKEQEEQEHEINDEGEKVLVKKRDGGPWNKNHSTVGAQASPGKIKKIRMTFTIVSSHSQRRRKIGSKLIFSGFV